MSADAQPCVCGCGATFRRPRSMPICAAASALVDERLELLPLPVLSADPRLVRSNRVWGSRPIVTALATGDLATAERLYRERIARPHPWSNWRSRQAAALAGV